MVEDKVAKMVMSGIVWVFAIVVYVLAAIEMVAEPVALRSLVLMAITMVGLQA